MHCSDFLSFYSDYRDGLISDARVFRRLNRHIVTCDSCARYDASVRAGVQALRRAAGELEPRPQFRERLRARIAAGAEPAVPVTPGAAGIATLLMLAAALALVIHQRSSTPAVVTVPELAAAEPVVNSGGDEFSSPMVMVNPSAPFVTFTDLSVDAFHGTATSYSPHQVPIDTWANSLPR